MTMTLAQLIAEVDEYRPNQFDEHMKTGWINEIEEKAVKEVINRALFNAVEFTPYDYDTDAETVLLIPDSHKDVYETYLFAKMNYINAEFDRYNADSAMHAAAWREYAAEYRREHYPYPHETTIHYINTSPI